MIIILGMDNTGKTTLFERICHEFELNGEHSPGPVTRECQTDWMLEQMVKEKEGGEHSIYDRFSCFEEMIYGKVLRDNPQYNFESPEVRLLKGTNPLIIYARPPKECILGFEDGREQMEGVKERGVELLEAYDELYFKLKSKGWAVAHYDYTNPESKEKVKNVCEKYLGGELI
jgi:GTPase SAR1 family protein